MVHLTNASVFQAEVVAYQAALLWLNSNPHRLKGTNVKLWLDSPSALQSIFSLKPTSKLVEATIEVLVSAKLIYAYAPNRTGFHSRTLRYLAGNKQGGPPPWMGKENSVAVHLHDHILLRTEKQKRKQKRCLLKKVAVDMAKKSTVWNI